jgi:hypothetical protein
LDSLWHIYFSFNRCLCAKEGYAQKILNMLIADNDKRGRLDDICLQQENGWSLVCCRGAG